jgi:L-Ala-D/L-Glu epimerase
MKIVRVSYERMDLQLSVPYTIAYETITKSCNFILKVETESMLVGYGCAAPDKKVTGEEAGEVAIIIQDIIIPFLLGRNPFTYPLIMEELKSVLGRRSSTLAMVDMAMHDLISRKAGIPLYRYLGAYRNSIATSITIGILPLEETLKMAQEYVKRGFNILKVKGGSVLEEDIDKMLRLHEMFPEIILRFDGNQGYSVADAIAFDNATRSVKVEIFEQPTEVGREEWLGEVNEQVIFPVMADESIMTLSDAFRLARNKHVRMINIKLMKVGGILEAMHINSIARAAHQEVMVGCMDECALGISAGLHFALSRFNIKYADLDGHLDILNDPFSGLFRLENGILIPSEDPGLGRIRY